jgi:hypothetical protein
LLGTTNEDHTLGLHIGKQDLALKENQQKRSPLLLAPSLAEAAVASQQTPPHKNNMFGMDINIAPLDITIQTTCEA